VTLRWAAGLFLHLAFAGQALTQQVTVPSVLVPDTATGLAASVLTLGRDAEVWELWGHNTIVLADRDRKASRSYNWGLFDFRQENFILRFARGQMWYSMGAHPTTRELAYYASRDRTMVLQDLALTPLQATALQAFLEWNDTPANRGYFYNYYLDNCSTRVRDAVDRAVGGQLKAQFDTLPSGHTWRWETRRILGWNLPLYVVINLALGHPVDVEMTAWQAMFLPRRVMEYLRAAKVAAGSGQPIPLVRREQELNRTTHFVDPDAPKATWIPLLLTGLLAGGLLLQLGAAARTSVRARRWFTALGCTWSFTAGLLGALLLALWFLTDHITSRNNENVLLLTPLSLALVVLLPRALKGRAGAVRAAVNVASVVAGLALLALVIKVLPWFRQYNLELIALILPVHLGLLSGLKRATTPT
jgi:Domain of unknown function (DUF4105)